MARHKAFSGGVFGQHKPLEAIAKPCSCFSAQTKGGMGVFAAASRGSEICVATEAPESTASGRAVSWRDQRSARDGRQWSR